MPNQSEPDQPPTQRLNNIALSLSGGGVRAVGFHLGLLEMLDRLDLLKRVTILSTVSGGSLTGTGYALSQHFGHSFDQYFGDFYDFLPEINTIEELLKGMTGRSAPAPSGRRAMITALANLYDESYFKKYFGLGKEGLSPRFGVFWEEDSPSHLKEIIFNATEFQTGTAFRFQKSHFDSIIGNANIFLCEEHARKLRMADIMAASCCIPVGMEPLFFPDDFHWPDDVGEGANAERPTCNAIKKQLRENLPAKFRLHQDADVDFFALMDGGVYDNQGIVSLLLAMNRLVSKVPSAPADHCICGKSLYEDHEPPGPEEWARWIGGQIDAAQGGDSHELEHVGWRNVDLLIISDTPVRKDSLYPKLPDSRSPANPEDDVLLNSAQPGSPRRWIASHITLGGFERLLFGMNALLLTSAIAAIGLVWRHRKVLVEPGDAVSITMFSLQVVIPILLVFFLGLGSALFRRWVVARSNKLYGLLPKDRWGVKRPWAYIKKISLSDLTDMVRMRLESATALTASVYMNRIRSLGYSALFSRQRINEHVLTNEIFALEKTSDGYPDDWPADWPSEILPLTEDLSAIIMLAAHMQTKLWINRIDKGIEGYVEHVQGDDPISRATRRVLDLNEKREANSLEPLTDLDVLVISGQLTSCYRLMVHAWENLRLESAGWVSEEAEAFFAKASGIWNQFQEKPAGQLDDRKRRSHEARHKGHGESKAIVLT